MMNKININTKKLDARKPVAKMTIKKKIALYGLFGCMLHGSVVSTNAGPEQRALYDRFQNNLELFACVVATNDRIFDSNRDGSYHRRLFNLICFGMDSALSELTEDRGEYKYPQAMCDMDIDELRSLTLGNSMLENDSLALFTVLCNMQSTEDTKVRDTTKIFEFLPIDRRGNPSDQGVDKRLTHDSPQRNALLNALDVIEKRVKDLKWFDEGAVFVNAAEQRENNAAANAGNMNAGANNRLAPAPARPQPIAPQVDPNTATNIEKYTIDIIKAIRDKSNVPAAAFQYLIDHCRTRASVLLNRMQALGRNDYNNVGRDIHHIILRENLDPYIHDPHAAQVILGDVDQGILEGRARIVRGGPYNRHGECLFIEDPRLLQQRQEMILEPIVRPRHRRNNNNFNPINNNQIDRDVELAMQLQEDEWLMMNPRMPRRLNNQRAQNQPVQNIQQFIAPALPAIVPPIAAPQIVFQAPINNIINNYQTEHSIDKSYDQSASVAGLGSIGMSSFNFDSSGFVNISKNSYNSYSSKNTIQSNQWNKDEKNTQKQLDHKGIEALANELELTNFRAIQNIPSSSVIVPKHIKELHNLLGEFLSRVDGKDLLSAKLLSAAYKTIDSKTAKAFLQEYEVCKDEEARVALAAKHYSVIINNILPLNKMNADQCLNHLKVLYSILDTELPDNVDSLRPEIIKASILRHDLFNNISDPETRELFAGDMELLSIDCISKSQREGYEKAKANEEKRAERRKDLFMQMNTDYIRNGVDTDIFNPKTDVKAVNKFARILGLRAMELNVLLPKVLFSDTSYISGLVKKYGKALDQVTERNDVLQIVRSATADILDRLYSRKNTYTQEQLLEIVNTMYYLYDMDYSEELIDRINDLFAGDIQELSIIKSKDKVAGNELITFARSLINMGKNGNMSAKRFENSENPLIEILTV